MLSCNSCWVGTAALTAFLFVVSPADAATVTNLTGTNTSATTTHPGGTGISRSYDSLLTQTQGLQTSGNETTFAYRLQWNNAIHVNQPAGSRFALINNKRSGYTLNFTIEDPTNTGYTLGVDAMLRGDLFADWDPPESGSSTVTASGGTVSVKFDDDTTDGTLPQSVVPLFLAAGGTSATLAAPSNTKVIDLQAIHELGTFFGTRSFELSFTTWGSPTSVFMSNYGAGEASARYGLSAQHSGNAASPSFNNAVYGIGGTPGDDGHFATITVTSIPEPATLSIFALAGLLGLRRR